MSSNKDFLPSSSPVSSICAIEIIAILFLFMMNCYKSLFQECIKIIVLKAERTRNHPPYCLLQIQEKMAFHLPQVRLSWDSRHPPPESVPTDGRTLTSEPKFFRSTAVVVGHGLKAMVDHYISQSRAVSYQDEKSTWRPLTGT